MTESITQAYLRSILDYDPATGVFTWRWRDDVPKGWNTKWARKEAGSIHSSGYRIISIRKRRYKANRLAWKWMTGEWPDAVIDHKNRHRGDDRWLNLRPATGAQNSQNKSKQPNNTSGYKGVRAVNRRWKAQISRGDRTIRYLGYFDTAEEAARAYDRAAREQWDEYAALNFPE